MKRRLIPCITVTTCGAVRVSSEDLSPTIQSASIVLSTGQGLSEVTVVGMFILAITVHTLHLNVVQEIPMVALFQTLLELMLQPQLSPMSRSKLGLHPLLHRTSQVSGAWNLLP